LKLEVVFGVMFVYILIYVILLLYALAFHRLALTWRCA